MILQMEIRIMVLRLGLLLRTFPIPGPARFAGPARINSKRRPRAGGVSEPGKGTTFKITMPVSRADWKAGGGDETF
jgi:hypothetical protein